MWKYLLVAIICVVIALFSDHIDKLFNGNKVLQKVVFVFSGGVMILCLMAAFISIL